MSFTEKICLKCGRDGHASSMCKGPVTSFGLVVYAYCNQVIKCGRMYHRDLVECNMHGMEHLDREKDVHCKDGDLVFLLVERKDTVGFLNLVQGAYSDTSPYKERKVKRYLYELTCNERKKLCTTPFHELWKIAGSNKRDARKAEKRLEKLNVAKLLNHENPCQFTEADYLMPKGRLRRGETVQQCAIREFAEETGYSRSHVSLLSHIPPYEEHFIGTDGKNYRNVFFVAKMKEDAEVVVRLGSDPQQSKEVRNVGWFTFPQCKQLIRGYHDRKLNILKDVFHKVPSFHTDPKLSNSRKLSISPIAEGPLVESKLTEICVEQDKQK